MDEYRHDGDAGMRDALGAMARQFEHDVELMTSTAERTIAVLSPAYFGSEFGEAEWRVAFTKDHG